MTTGGRQYTARKTENENSRRRRAAEAAGMVDVERLQRSVAALTGFGPRHGGSSPDGHRAAAEWVEAELTDLGYQIKTQSFDIPEQDPPRTGLNVIATHAKHDPAEPAILLGAHYDTVAGSPGADDNASGVAAMLECARVIAALPRHQPVVFAAFDAEETQAPSHGLHGSIAFALSLRDRGAEPLRITGAYILEMVGYSAPPGGQAVPNGMQLIFPRAFDMLRESRFAGDSLVAITNAKSRWMSRRLEDSARTFGDGLKILPMEVPGWMKAPLNLRRSDHAPFWEAGIPAVMIGDTANFRNPAYHRPTDIPDTLDYGLIAQITRAMVASLV